MDRFQFCVSTAHSVFFNHELFAEFIFLSYVFVFFKRELFAEFELLSYTFIFEKWNAYRGLFCYLFLFLNCLRKIAR